MFFINLEKFTQHLVIVQSGWKLIPLKAAGLNIHILKQFGYNSWMAAAKNYWSLGNFSPSDMKNIFINNANLIVLQTV
jgi:hypothetical protein